MTRGGDRAQTALFRGRRRCVPRVSVRTRGSRASGVARLGGRVRAAVRRGRGPGGVRAAEQREKGAQAKRSGAGRAGRGSAVGPRSRGGGKERKKGRKRKKRGRNGKIEKRKRNEEERKRERESGIRGVTDARSATRGAWARVSGTRGSREKQGAGYECRDRSFGNRKIETGRSSGKLGLGF